MGKYTLKNETHDDWRVTLLMVLNNITNELAEANRLKRIELQCLKVPVKLAEKLGEQIEDRA